MRRPVQFSSVEEQNRNRILGKFYKENMFSKDDKLQSKGQSSSDTSSLLNTYDSSYQTVEDKIVVENCTDHDHEVIESTRDPKPLDQRYEDIGSQGDNISCVSGIDKVEDHVERENGLNGATSEDKSTLMDKMVDKFVYKSNSSEIPLLKERSTKDNGSLIDVEGAGIKERNEKLCAPLEQQCSDTPTLSSQLANTTLGSTTIEDEVRVCDICGDLGREYMLAICSKCSDGAEHIYCMWAPMNQVPEGDWLCEDCEMKHEYESQNQFKVDSSKKSLMRIPSIKDVMPKTKSLVSSSSLKNPLSFERRNSSTVVSPNNNDFLVLRKRSLEGYAESTKGSSPKRRLVKSYIQKSSIGNSVASNLKSRLLKSKSFGVMDLKLKDHLSRQDSLKNSTTIDVCEKKFQKSISFNNARIGTSVPDMEKAKKMVIKARPTIQPISSKKISTFKSRLPNFDKKTTSYGKMVLPTYKANPHDQDAPQSCSLPSRPLDRKSSVKAESCPKPNGFDSDTPRESDPLINLPCVLSIYSQESVIPRSNWDWRGSFEVSSGWVTCTRIQAHCSSRASDNVLDLVRKLPSKIVLEELPQRRVFPTQLTENNPMEENIALFFFAEDLKSYDSYKNMLKRMMNNEFALRGHMDGAELLIFSSSILPPSSQRWNNLLFLWGLFRRRPDGVPHSSAACSDSCLSLQPVKTEPCLPKTTPQKKSDEMIRDNKIIKKEKLKVLHVDGTNHLRQSTCESPASLNLCSEVPGPRYLDPKPLRGYESRDYDIHEEQPNKRMKSCSSIVTTSGFDFVSTISLGSPFPAMDECKGVVDLELSLGTVQKREASRSGDELGSVSLSLSLGLPFS